MSNVGSVAVEGVSKSDISKSAVSIVIHRSKKFGSRKGTMKLTKVRKGIYEYKCYNIAYLPERRIWNIATYGFAGWNFQAEFRTLKECRQWVVQQLEEVRTEKPRWKVRPCGCPEDCPEGHQEGCHLSVE